MPLACVIFAGALSGAGEKLEGPSYILDWQWFASPGPGPRLCRALLTLRAMVAMEQP